MCVSFVAQAQTAVGRIEGQASVSSTGAAQYSVPLAVPPGTNGLAPGLAIVYDHRSGNGLLGVGFRLAGFSAIRRCGGTIAQDGAISAVGLDAADRFCLDGQRLRLTSGSYGQAGSQYQTEVETFSRVTAFGTAGTGPAWFQVERRDGLIYQYGATDDSRIESSGSGTPREWALNRIRDRSGNYVDFVYVEDMAAGSYRPSRIDYTGNASAGAAPYYSVRFTYETRTSGDQPAGYVGGGLVQEHQRLARIDAQHSSGTVLLSYVLSYQSDPNGGRSRLSRMQACAGASCLKPSTFTWSAGTPGWSTEASLALDAATLGGAFTGDSNGDGFEDLAYYESTARRWLVLPGGPAGLASGPIDTGLGSDGAASQALWGDLDGNGRRDLVVPVGGQWQWLRHSNGSSYLHGATGVAVAAQAGSTALADIDGDGRDDFVYVKDSGAAIAWRRNLTAGGVPAFATEALLWTAPSGTRIAAMPFLAASQRSRSAERRADFNGDGRDDLLLRVQVDACGGTTGCTANWTERWQVFASRGNALVAQSMLDGASDPLLADFNADGLTDVVYAYNGFSWRLALGIGRRGAVEAGLSPPVGSSAPASGSIGKALVVDWDGDGRTDLLIPGASEWLACRSLGTIIETCRGAGLASSGVLANSAVLDADGDGLPDLAVAASSSRFRPHSPGRTDLLVAAEDGHGVRAEFEYSPLTRPGVHAASQSSAYPVADYAAPALVVSRLTASDGAGGTYRLDYAYEGAKTHALGRGFLGFARSRVSDSRDGLTTVSDYLQDPAGFDQVGSASAASVARPDGSLLVRTTYAWGRIASGAGYETRSFPYVASQSTDRYELDGTRVSNTYLRNTVDAYGTVTSRLLQTTEVGTGLNPGAQHWERRALTSVVNDTANWCLGRALGVQETRGHSLPGGAEASRTVSRTVDPSRCRVTQEVDEPNDPEMRLTTDFVYDAYGNLTSRTSSAPGQSSRTTSYAWTAGGRFPQSVTNAEGHRTSYAWDAIRATRTSQTDPNMLVTQWTYDEFGRPLREIRPDGTRTELTRGYCGASCLASTAVHTETVTSQGSGGVAIGSTVTAFDMMDRAVYSVADQPGGAVTRQRAFTDRGQVARVSVPAGCCAPPAYWTAYSYDLLGRPVRMERPASGADPTPVAVRWTYSGLGVTRTDALGRTTASRLDVRGNVLQSVDAGGADMDYEYDPNGNLLRATDVRGNETVMTYGPRGLRTSIRDVDAGLRSWRYTPFGEVRSETNARGQTVSYTYDRLSRRLTRQELEGTTTWTWGRTWGARNIGALYSVSSPGWQATYTFDSVGRPSVETVSAYGSSFVTRLSYDTTTGLLDTLTYPAVSGSAPLRVRHHYDRGRLVRLTDADDPSTTFWQLDAVDARGTVAAETLGNGVRVASTNDAVTGLLTSRVAGLGGGSSHQDLRYTWDAGGNLAAREEANLGVSETFGYDVRDRLDFVRSSSGAIVDLDYDEIGNVTYKSDVGTYQYDATKKHAVVRAGENTYAYDANGDVVNASGTTIAWTSYDLPVRIAHTSGNYSNFEYGPDRARIRQVALAGGETTETVYAAGGLYERVTRGGVVSQRHYVVADGRRVAVQTRVAGTSPSTVYLLEDHLGGVDGFTSATGALLSRTSNQPFGARRSGDWVGSTPTSSEWNQVKATTPRGFTDHEHVDNLGVIHMNGRVYDPVLARFLSPDPVVQAPYDSQSWNRYSYVRNNPLRYTDPTGFCFNGHPAADNAVQDCLRRIVEAMVVQASRIPGYSVGSVVVGGDIGVGTSDFLAAGGMSGADAVFVAGGGVPEPPTDNTPVEEVVVTAPAAAPYVPVPMDVVIAVSVSGAISSAARNVYEVTTQMGDSAAETYADLQAETGNPLLAVPGALASLWTPKTAPETLLVLGSAAGLGKWSGRPFWQYFPAGDQGYRSTWLTRGAGWRPPYEAGAEAASNLALPSYNPGTAVRAVQPKWNQYVRGPRIVQPQPEFGPGAVGGGREYRVIPFEK
jgi:RHS repeat-associated protein